MRQMLNNQYLTTILAGFLLVISNITYAGGIESLKQFYDQTHSMSANFHQTVTDNKGRKVQEVFGEMKLKRPNKFRWDYNKPFEQQIISDGKQVWLYDIELAQVTVREVSKALGASPAALLSGDDSLDDNFTFTGLSRQSPLDWVSVTPKANDIGYSRIVLGFNKNVLQEMEMVDSLGQHTMIEFSQQVQNPVIPAKTFLFKPPKNVDVVGE